MMIRFIEFITPVFYSGYSSSYKKMPWLKVSINFFGMIDLVKKWFL